MLVSNNNNKVYLILLAYILGLLVTGFNYNLGHFTLIVIVTIFSVIIALAFPSSWRFYITKKWFIIAGLILIISYYYYQWRLPSPKSSDISHHLINIEQTFNDTVEITGRILTPLQVNRNQKSRFIIEVNQLETTEVTGKVYVTAPLLETNNFFPSMEVTLRGRLYQPSVATHPGGFDFANFLARQGIWTGFTAEKVSLNKFGNVYQQSLFWLRRRVIKTHVRYLDIPDGALVSAMVIGNRGVDLSFEIQDLFRDGGLAHILAASGFHVSLLLGVILWLTQKFSASSKFFFGVIGLLFYVTLTGFYPSVLRASIMGLGVLVALVRDDNSAHFGDNRVNVLAMLLLTAVILLLINPLWIWDLGFQFSFLATFGLVVTLPGVIARLDFLPPTIATIIAVPLSATIWILPLQGYVFNRLPLYSIFTNVLATPFVFILSLGGMISGLIGLFFPLLGSAIALILLPFSWSLIKLVEIINNFPFASLAIGQISLSIVLITYGIYVSIWQNVWCRKKWFWLSLFVFSLIVIPLGYQKINTTQVTIIKGTKQPLVVIENKTKNYLINIPNKSNYDYVLKNFFNYQGINKLDSIFIDTNTVNNKDYQYIKEKITIKEKNENINSKFMKIAQDNSSIIQWQIENKSWLLINTNKNVTLPSNITIDTLIWSGENIDISNIEKLKPNTVIFYEFVSPMVQKTLEEKKINVFSIIDSAVIQWQPEKGFYSYQREGI